MAQLYSRYVPPSKIAKSTQPQSAYLHAVAPAEPVSNLKHKRKRENARHTDSERPRKATRQPDEPQHVGSTEVGTAKERRHGAKKTKVQPTDGASLQENGPLHGQRVPPERTKHLRKVDPDDALTPKGKANGHIRELDSRRENKVSPNAAQLPGARITEASEESVSKAHAGVLSKSKKSRKVSSARQSKAEAALPKDDIVEAVPILNEITPIVPPTEDPNIHALPTFPTLPSWLSNPIIVRPTVKLSFEQLRVELPLVERLQKKGFETALPIQAGVLPLLLPTERQHPGDVCVSAATGSGKTLAYILPIVQSLMKRPVRKLRALVVVPTRELVSQGREVADLCAQGQHLEIGTATGAKSLKAEQTSLIQQGRKFDPEKYRKMHPSFPEALASDIEDDVADNLINSEDDARNLDSEDVGDMGTVPGYMPEYKSKIDILFCTPGRLVEHLRSTRGFTLQDIEWLVIDEADKLLGQSFQDWAGVLMKAVSAGDQSLRYVEQRGAFLNAMLGPPPRFYARKVILSATMTTDLDKLASLGLRNPKLVIVERENDNAYDKLEVEKGDHGPGALRLPHTLQEAAIPVGDGLEKPLFLVTLLRRLLDPHELNQMRRDKDYADFTTRRTSKFEDSGSTKRPSASSDLDSRDSLQNDSDTTDSNSIDSDTSDSESSDSDSSDSPLSSSSTSTHSAYSPAILNGALSTVATLAPKPGARDSHEAQNVLIFTASNESSHRLTHLLKHLLRDIVAYDPDRLASLTASTSPSAVRQTLADFKNGKLRILVATDRASRGLDLPSLANVINYDIPRSVTSYVHRVGRTARAGKAGSAWTLVEDREAAWFWKIVARGPEIDRSGASKVERLNMRLEEGSQGATMRSAYSLALERLRQDVER